MRGFFLCFFVFADFCLCFSFSEEILNPSVPMALRLSGILMGEFNFACAPENFPQVFSDGFLFSVIKIREQVAW